MEYKRKWNIKNNYFIQYFNKLHEKNRERKKSENYIWHVIKKEKRRKKKWYLIRLSRSSTQPTPLDRPSPNTTVSRSCQALGQNEQPDPLDASE